MELKLNKEQHIQLLDCMAQTCCKFDNCDDCNILYLCNRVCGINNPLDMYVEARKI